MNPPAPIIRRAMVLAAGLGTRLRPITHRIPKPLLPFFGRPLIAWTLRWLARSGVREVVINTHHLGDQLRRTLGDGAAFGLGAVWSDEQPEILGTGGGVRKALEHFRNEPFFIINSDTLIDLDLHLLEQCLLQGAAAAMAVRSDPDASRFGAVSIRGKRVLRIRGEGISGGDAAEETMFTGIHAVTPDFIRRLPEQGPSCIIRQAYIPALRDNETIAALKHDGYWADLGSPARVLAAARDILHGARPFGENWPEQFAALAGGRWISGRETPGVIPPCAIAGDARIGEGAIIGPDVVIEPGVIAGEDIRVRRSMLLDGARCPDHASLDHAILYGGMMVKAD
ncbi:MAG: Bifunctional protein GlmU [Myxococcota bacterium]|nr:Bifunctional protein GlmU [Myxococcota bacterium]